MSRLIFSGHESFFCKQFWLKKGFDFIDKGKKFTDNSAVIELGVGKNMVRAIRFWLYAFGVSDERSSSSPSELGEFLFGKNGRDPFLEDIGSAWLLHYHLVTRGNASIYNIFFNEFRNTRNEFHVEQLHNFLKQRCLENQSTTYNENTINRDIKVFIANYSMPERKRSQIEDVYSGLLQELNLFDHKRKEDVITGKVLDYYSVLSNEKEGLPYQILLYAILDNDQFGKAITFKDLQFSKNSPGRVFAITAEGLFKKIEAIENRYKEITFSETAGNRQLQVSSALNKWDILDDYYQK